MENVGGVEGLYEEDSLEGEYATRKVIGNAIEGVGIATVHASPLWLRITLENERTFDGVFIRAPAIKKIGDDVKPIAWKNKEIVGCISGRNMALTFHPELTNDAPQRSYHHCNTISNNEDDINLGNSSVYSIGNTCLL